jgi:type I restriction enzyme S subunit
MTSAPRRATLGDVCDFRNGLWKGEKPPFATAGVIRNTNFTNDGGLDDSDIAYMEVEERKLSSRRLQFGDIILEKSGGGPRQPVGRVALFDKEDGVFSFSNFTSALRVRDPNQLDFRFLHKFLYWTYLSGKTALIQSHATGIRNLDTDAYKAIVIGIPSLAEQKRTVSILNQVFEATDSAKRNAERNLSNVREVFDSYLDALFGNPDHQWVGKSLRDICEIKHGFAFDGADFSNEVPEGHPIVVTPGNFSEDGTLIFGERNTKRFKRRPPKHLLFDIGDLVVVMTDLSSKMKILGKPAFVEENNLLHNQRIGRVVFRSADVLPRLVYYFMLSERFLAKIRQSATGTMVRHTAPTRVLDNVIRYPLEPKTQSAVVEKLDALRDQTISLRGIYERKMVELRDLHLSVLNQAFVGGLQS